MKNKFISLILGMLSGMSWFVFSQYEKNERLSMETDAVNAKIMELSEIEGLRKNEAEAESVKEALKNAMSEKNVVEFTVTDSFQAFENLYDSAKKDSEFSDLMKKPKFLESKEFFMLERLKSRTLTTSVKINGNKRIDTVGIPEFLSCERLSLKSPCMKVSDDSIPYADEKSVRVVFDDRTFTPEDAVSILAGRKNF